MDSWRSEFGSAASPHNLLVALNKLDEATALRERVGDLIQKSPAATLGDTSVGGAGIEINFLYNALKIQKRRPLQLLQRTKQSLHSGKD